MLDSGAKLPSLNPFSTLYFALLARLSLCFTFSFCELQEIIVFTSEGFHEN